jgi:hypothetical protein
MSPATRARLVQSDWLMAALAEAVTWAMYWQPPDAEDVLLEDPRVVDALIPVATVIAAAVAVNWWTSPMCPDQQHCVAWLEPGQSRGQPPALEGAPAQLAAWRAETRREERRAHNLPSDPAAPYSGWWWSTPRLTELVTTTRNLGALPAVQLALVEDPPGFERARVARLQPAHGLRIFEIASPQDWIELVQRYPIDVSWSRRHDWWRVTRCSGPWLIPDWAAVGADYDGVHLTVLGYLSTAGRSLPVGDSNTLLAGFDPDVTYWLNDVLSQATEPETWHQVRRNEEFLAWEPESERPGSDI